MGVICLIIIPLMWPPLLGYFQWSRMRMRRGNVIRTGVHVLNKQAKQAEHSL